MTSIALSPRSCASARLSICLPRRRNDAVAIGAPLRQFSLQPLGLIVHSHPAQLANALDDIVCAALTLRGIVMFRLCKCHWQHILPRLSVWLYRLHATQTSDVAVWACRSIVAPLAGANRASSAKPSALTYWPARARVQACAAAYCGGTLAGAISNTGSAAVRCGALRRRQEEAQKRCDRGDDGEMTDTTMGQYLRRITGGDEPRRASALAT